MIGRPELAEDPAYCEHWLDSGEWAANMRAIMDEGFGKMTVQEAKDKFREYDLAFGEICGPDDVLKDPQALENNMLAPHTTLRGDHVMFATSPLKFEDDSPCEDAPAPRLGQHTTEIMRMAGYSDEEILAMSEAGIVRSE